MKRGASATGSFVVLVSSDLGLLVVGADPVNMSTETETVRRPWESQSGAPRKALARRKELLVWMLDSPENQGVSGQEIADRCPVYSNVAPNPYTRVIKDLRNMEEIECTVVGSRNRPVQWSVTTIGIETASRR